MGRWYTDSIPGAAKVAEAGHVVQPLRHQHLVVEGVALGQVADPALGLSAGVGERGAVQPDDPGVGLEELGDHPHGGGFPGAIRAQESHHLAAVHGESDTVHGGDAVEALGDAIERK
jgi:hypothetical protein